jgi:two-component sensor histidine kinase
VDDGVGLTGEPAGSLGLEIVQTLVKDDLHGTIKFDGSPAGTRVLIHLPPAASFQEAE